MNEHLQKSVRFANLDDIPVQDDAPYNEEAADLLFPAPQAEDEVRGGESVLQSRKVVMLVSFTIALFTMVATPQHIHMLTGLSRGRTTMVRLLIALLMAEALHRALRSCH